MRIPVEIEGTFKARTADCDKYSVGVVSVIGGSEQYPNAPVIAGLGARSAGAGLVRLVVPDASRYCAGALLPEATFTKLWERVAVPRADVVVIGMGLGQGTSQENLMERVFTDMPGRFVVDADALAILAKQGKYKPVKNQEVVLTPHEGEAAKLLGVTREKVSCDRRKAALSLAKKYGATIILKGSGTLVVSRDGKRIYENATGNPNMALGGMGDLLAGVVAARWAYLKGEAFDAAACAVWLHGAAGDALAAAAADPSIVNTASRIASLRVQMEKLKG